MLIEKILSVNVLTAEEEILLNNYTNSGIISKDISKTYYKNKKYILISKKKSKNINYSVNKEMREAIVRINLINKYKFNIYFDEKSGFLSNLNIYDADLKFFCNSFSMDSYNSIISNLFNDNSENGSNVFIIYTDKFSNNATLLSKKFPKAKFFKISKSSSRKSVEQILEVSKSRDRSKKIQSLDWSIRFNTIERVRKDFDKVLFLIEYEQAKSIIPAFRSYGVDKDYFVTLDVFKNINDFNDLNNLEGVYSFYDKYFFNKINQEEFESIGKAKLEFIKNTDIEEMPIILNTGYGNYTKGRCQSRQNKLWKISFDKINQS